MAKSGPLDPVVVLGAGYAGVALTHEVRRVGKGAIPVLVVDRHPSHTIRTRLYEVGRLAAAGGRSERWAVPIDQVLSHDGARFRAGEVQGIDLEGKTVRVDAETIPYRSLAICLGSVAAYYGIPGAEAHTEQVYRFAGALRLAERLRALAREAARPGGIPPRIVVVGGGSTGTEVAAEIATANWSKIIGAPTPPMDVTLVVGEVPFLDGLPPPLIRHAQKLLERATVRMIPGTNVREVTPESVELKDGQSLRCDVAIWCAGLAAPPLVKDLRTVHGRGGRIAVTANLELPDHPGVFAVGDVMELKDPRTGMFVPGTAQAALAEAPIAGRNIVAHLRGAALTPFHYQERGVVISVGRGQGSGRFGGVSIWGRPAALLKAVVDGEYASAAERGREPPGL